MYEAQAKDCVNAFFRDTNDALLTGAFPPFAQWFALPYDVHCFEGKVRCTVMPELRAMFDRVHAYYAKNGVRDLIRMVRELHAATPDRIQCLYETRVIIGRHTLFEEPFFGLSELVRTPEGWKVLRTEYDIVPTDVKHSVLLGSEEDGLLDSVEPSAPTTKKTPIKRSVTTRV